MNVEDMIQLLQDFQRSGQLSETPSIWVRSKSDLIDEDGEVSIQLESK
jgi:hypothetical protein